ncbi:MAG: hypothetical protein WC389_19625 [Lutibacter sp.]|jgi:hypothetical protein
MIINDYLNEIEKNELAKFVENRVQFEAVKKVVLACIYFDGTIQKEGIPNPLKNFLLAIAAGSMGTLTREQLGEKVEASLAGVQLLESGFKELEKFSKKQDAPKVNEKNPAR